MLMIWFCIFYRQYKKGWAISYPARSRVRWRVQGQGSRAVLEAYDHVKRGEANLSVFWRDKGLQSVAAEMQEGA